MTTLTSPSTEQLKQQVDLLLHSPSFASSETLRKLLAFLAKHAIESPSEILKVREIAVAVFSRTEDFDSQTDSVVRVHTGRLRSKLAEYYMEEGADDEVIITIPKGGYALTCHFRSGTIQRPAESPTVSTEHADPLLLPMHAGTVDLAPASPRHNRTVSLRFLILSLIAVAVVTWGISSYTHGRAQERQLSPALRALWQPFAPPAEKSLVIFSNFRFLSSNQNAGLVTYTGPDDETKPIIETYTSMGEVMGVFNVSHILHLLGRQPDVKRSRLLTWDEAKDSNLIFIGGPIAETPLRDIPLLKAFQFTRAPWKQGGSVGAIVNRQPRSGEDPLYLASDSLYANASLHASRIDYAVVALRPSFNASHRVLIMAGISEYGTQGATEFATSDAAVQDLLVKLDAPKGGPVPPFEALIRVQVEGGVPVRNDLVLLRKD